MRPTQFRRTTVFVPPAGGPGKWHALPGNMSEHPGRQACCSGLIELDLTGGRIVFGPDYDPDRVHPICCRRCLRLVTQRSDR